MTVSYYSVGRHLNHILHLCPLIEIHQPHPHQGIQYGNRRNLHYPHDIHNQPLPLRQYHRITQGVISEEPLPQHHHQIILKEGTGEPLLLPHQVKFLLGHSLMVSISSLLQVWGYCGSFQALHCFLPSVIM